MPRYTTVLKHHVTATRDPNIVKWAGSLYKVIRYTDTLVILEYGAISADEILDNILPDILKDIHATIRET